MLSFIAALYNEEKEVVDLINHVEPYVDGIYLADDGSTDLTNLFVNAHPKVEKISLKTMKHTGLPETVKNEALKAVPDGSWVLMLDADERFAPGVLEQIRGWLEVADLKYMGGEPVITVTHVYFNQIEIIDGKPVRNFQKAKLFKKEAITFSTGIHADDVFEGKGLYREDWIVYHRKTSEKQKQRELEYLATYDRLFEEGKIDEGRRQWLRNLHHFHRTP
jgi:glycosyltransferase involved in cell wall biosynthesis